MENLLIKRALLSVTDKTGLSDLAEFLSQNGVEIISTGGTLAYLQTAGIPATAVSEVTRFPEILGGRVKTLHPNIHAGILANKDKAADMETLASLKIRAFDLVCVNLYDFSGSLKKDAETSALIENIDIGGPCLLRAAAKNFNSILVLPGTNYYKKAIDELKQNSMHAGYPIRLRMAHEAFKLTSQYDNMIAEYLKNLLS